MRPMRPRRDTAPSVLRYRLGRLWLTPTFRRVLRIGPLIAIVLGGGAYVATDDTTRAQLSMAIATARDSIKNRDEFRVAKLQIQGASPEVSDAVTDVAAARLPASSLDLDVSSLRAKIETLPSVSTAAVRIGPGGVLQIDLTERVPMLLWRQSGVLHVLDQDGAKLGTIEHRADRADLPLILGDGAAFHVAEALDLLVAAGPIADRVRGLQRVADRRWNLVLDRDQIIMLPQNKPRAALRRVMGLHQADDILTRDVSVVDMRNGTRPVLRLGDFARNELKRLRAMENGDAQ